MKGTTHVEEIKMSRPVSASGNIEDWLVQMEKEMKRTMFREMKKVAKDSQIMDVPDLLKKHCAQCSLLAVQFIWTMEVEESLALSKLDKDSVKRAQSHQNELLNTLSQMTLEEIPKKIDRRNIETLVTIQVHQKDADDFEWQKQLRCKERNSRI